VAEFSGQDWPEVESVEAKRVENVETVEVVEGGKATRNGYKEREAIHSRYAEIPGSLSGIIECKKSAEWWDVISDKNREWTDGPKHEES
jgi:hypothetical protein